MQYHKGEGDNIAGDKTTNINLNISANSISFVSYFIQVFFHTLKKPIIHFPIIEQNSIKTLHPRLIGYTFFSVLIGFVLGLLNFSKLESFTLAKFIFQLVYCFSIWSFYALIIYFIRRVFFKATSFTNILSISLQLFSTGFILNHFLILILSPFISFFKLSKIHFLFSFFPDSYFFYFLIQLVFLLFYTNWAFYLMNQFHKTSKVKPIFYGLLNSVIITLIVLVNIYLFIHLEISVSPSIKLNLK